MHAYEGSIDRRRTRNRPVAAGGGPGVLDRLPRGVDHAILDVRESADGWEILMRDVSAGLVREHDSVDEPACAQLARAMADLHDEFVGPPIPGLVELRQFLSLFAPDLATTADDANPLVGAVVRGWEAFHDRVDHDVADAVAGVHADPTGLATALHEAGTPTLIHGDFFLQNLALFPAEVILFDWSLATWAPGELEVAWFLTGTASRIPVTREAFFDLYREYAGPRFSRRAARLANLAGLVLLGWNKALDIVSVGDAAFRAREEADLAWWVARARECLDEEGIPGQT